MFRKNSDQHNIITSMPHTHTAIMTTVTKMTMTTTRMTSHDGPQERRDNNDQYIANTNDDSGDEADGTDKITTWKNCVGLQEKCYEQ